MKRCRSLAALLCLLAAAVLLPVSAAAAGSVDVDSPASLTITAQYDGAALPDVKFDIYLVSTMDESGELTPVEAFSAYADELDIRGRDDAAWQAMAEKLERELLLGNLGALAPTDTAVTDAAGEAHFPTEGKRLTLGLYLVPGTRTEIGGYVYSTAPFFVLVPEQDKETNTWNYDVTALAKPAKSPVLTDLEVIKIWKDEGHTQQRPQSISIQLLQDGVPYGEPVTLPYNGAWQYTWHDLDSNHKWTVTEAQVSGYQPPDIRQEGNTFIVTNTWETPGTPGEPNLPQTGQLWWPVPAMVAAGLLLVLIGLLRRRRARHGK